MLHLQIQFGITGGITRGLLSFCVNLARIIKVSSLISKIAIKGINSLSKMCAQTIISGLK